MNALLLCALLGLTAGAQDPAAQSSPATAPAPSRQAEPDSPIADCTVKGRVVNAATGEPLRKATVNLQKQGSRNAGRAKDVGPDGNFEFRVLQPGRYTLSASRTGFVRASYGAKKPGAPGSQLTLTPGQEIKDLIIPLQPHAVIAGRVTDEDGDPIANVTVSAARFMWQGKTRELMPAQVAMSNDLGEYRIFGLPPGSYVVQAIRRQDSGMPLEPEAAAPKPEESYVVTYYPGTTDSGSATRISVAAGAEVRAVDIRMVKSRVVRIHGKVLNANGKPVSEAMVILLPRKRGWSGWAEARHSVIQRETGFEFRDVPPGSYMITASLAGDAGSENATLSLDVGDHNIDDVVVTVSPGVEVNGTVKVEGGSLEGAATHVSLEPVEADGPAYMVGGAGATVNADGTFTMKGVRAGQYRLRVFRPESYLKAARAGDDDVLETPLEIGRGAAPKLELLVSTKAAEAAGTVKDVDGKPLTGAQVILFPEEKGRTEAFAYGMGTTDQYGAFKIKGLRPGEYKALAFEEFEYGDQMDPEFLKPLESKAKGLSLSEGATQVLELTAIPAATLNGQKAKRLE